MRQLRGQRNESALTSKGLANQARAPMPQTHKPSSSKQGSCCVLDVQHDKPRWQATRNQGHEQTTCNMHTTRPPTVEPARGAKGPCRFPQDPAPSGMCSSPTTAHGIKTRARKPGPPRGGKQSLWHTLGLKKSMCIYIYIYIYI